MKVSTRGRYALRVMIDLAQHNNGEYIPLSSIAQRQHVSEKYLENIVSSFAKNGFIIGMRGKHGGYRLSSPVDSYNVGEILKLAEGSLSPVSCVETGGKQCELADECNTRKMWKKLDELIYDYLKSVKLTSLLP